MYMESKPDLIEDADNDNTVSTRFRRDECLTVESVKLIGSELGRSLSDPAQEVRKESRLGFQVLFRRFRPVSCDCISDETSFSLFLTKYLVFLLIRFGMKL
jgi:hypothetical protein